MRESNKKDRVEQFGEVFTSSREVVSMLNMVNNETLRIDSRFLEPACGDGNFLIEILKRKLEVVAKNYSKNQYDFEKNIFIAVSNLYGVEILIDNVLKCRDRLFLFVKDYYEKYNYENEIFLKNIEFVLLKNILHGDALTLLNPDNNEPITFTEWSFMTGGKLKRTDYTLDNLLAYQPFDEENLFSDLGEEAFIPKPVKSYKIINFLDVIYE